MTPHETQPATPPGAAAAALAGPSPGIELRGAYRPRPVCFAGVHQLGDWRVKLYGVATPGAEPRPALMEAALRTAAEALPRPAVASNRYGVGFVIVHDAADYGFALVDWWYGENEIHQKVFSADLSRPDRFEPHFNDAIGCVWELSVTDFERRAWIQDVLANPDGPDLDLYLTREFNADV